MPSFKPIQSLKRVLIVSQIAASEIENLLRENQFRIVKKNPDLIVCYGGDGTILFAERNFPQVPKLIVKRTNICRKCDYTLPQLEDVLTKIRNGEFQLKKEIKLEAVCKNRKLIGLNEIQIHTRLPIYAIRFSMIVNGREYSNLIGDGAIISTPFGSTGYYTSVGGKQFENGIGIAFNNLHNKRIESFVVPESSAIRINVDRGSTWVLTDNNEDFFSLNDNGRIIIKKSNSVANLVYVP